MEPTMPACVFYDGNCPWCSRDARGFRNVLGRRGISVEPLQATEAKALLHVSDDELLMEMRLRLADGCAFGGAAAVVEIARRIWWAWPVWAVSRVAGAMDVMDAAYRRVARHRGCADGACVAPPRRNTSSPACGRS